jgi:SAM-dependent methyltransferase
VQIKHCPCCRTEAFLLTGPENSGFSVQISGKLFVQPNYSILECTSCGVLYRSVTLDPHQLDEYYRRVDYRKWEIPDLFPTEEGVLEKLRQIPAGGRLLDFGCSSGRLLSRLLPDYKCYGVELNAEASAAAKAKGITILKPSDLEGESCTFDAVATVDVFEHLDRPFEMMGQLFRLLKVGGAMVIVTGDGDHPVCRRAPGEFWYFRNVEHLCMLTKKCGLALARSLGAKLESWENRSHYDLSLFSRTQQIAQQFAYWHYRRRTIISKVLLPFVPYLRRAKHWQCAPAFTCGRDHMIAVFRKTS